MRKEDLVSILHGSFDAGLLLDESGAILHANTPALELFGYDETTTTTSSSSPAAISKGPIDAHVSFWTYSLSAQQQPTDRDTLAWKEVLWHVLHDTDPPAEWNITGARRKPKGSSFPGFLRITVVSMDHILVWMRHGDHHEAVLLASFGGDEHSLDDHDSGLLFKPRRRPRSQSILPNMDPSDDPMMAMDEHGTILMFNQMAVDTVRWCTEDLVGRHISETPICASTTTPLLTVDQHGTIVTVDTSGVPTSSSSVFVWCHAGLVGEHISTIMMDGGSHAAADGAAADVRSSARTLLQRGASSRHHASSTRLLETFSESTKKLGFMPFWQHQSTTTTSSAIQKRDDDEFRHKSPQVMRIFLQTTNPNHPPLHQQQHKLSLSHITTGAPSVVLSSLPPPPLGTTTTGNHLNTSMMDVLSVNSTTADAQQRDNILMAIFEASIDPLFQINQNGIIQMVNQAASRQFGWSRQDFLGGNISMICGGPHGPKHDSYLKRYLATGETRVMGQRRQLLAKRQDGTEFPIELVVVEVDTFLYEERLFCGFVRDLTLIKKKERLTTDIIEASLDPMFQIVESGRIRMVNEAAVRKFGYSRKELLGSNISIICGGQHAKKHNNYMKRYLRTGETKVIGKNRVLPAKRKDGTEFPIELAVVEMQTSAEEERMFVGFVHDLSAYARKDRILTGIIEAALDPLFQINDQGIIELCNEAAVNQFGWSKSEMLGQNISMLVGSEHAANHDQYIKRYLETGEARAIGKKRQLKARRKDGSEFAMELALAELQKPNEDGGQRLFVGFCRDLTKEKHYEHEIKRLGDEMSLSGRSASSRRHKSQRHLQTSPVATSKQTSHDSLPRSPTSPGAKHHKKHDGLPQLPTSPTTKDKIVHNDGLHTMSPASLGGLAELPESPGEDSRTA